MIVFGVKIFFLIFSISNFVSCNEIVKKSDEKLDENMLKNQTMYNCEELIEFVNQSDYGDSMHGLIMLKDVDHRKGLNLKIEFGIEKDGMELNKNYYPFVEFVEDENFPAVLDVNFGFTKPVPELVSIEQDDVMLCEKGEMISANFDKQKLTKVL